MIRGHRVERLDRHVPGQERWTPHTLPDALFVRDKALRPPRHVVGEHFELRTSKVRDARRTADTWPNAPLLKRLVLNPYPLYPDRVRRHQVQEPIPWDVLVRGRTPNALEIFREARIEPVQGSPVREATRRLVHRERPSVEDWIRSREVTP